MIGAGLTFGAIYAAWMGLGFVLLLILSVSFKWFDDRLPDSALKALAVVLVWPIAIIWIFSLEAVARVGGKRATA